MKQHEHAKLILQKAAEDEALVEEVIDSQRVSDEIVGFHLQQAAEKLLKAALTALGIEYHRTHNLRVLMDLLADHGQPLPPSLQDLDVLTPFAVLLRYETPHTKASLNRQSAQSMIQNLRAWVEPMI